MFTILPKTLPVTVRAVNHPGTTNRTKQTAGLGDKGVTFVFLRGQWGAERGVRKAIPKTECKKDYISMVLKLIRTFWSYSI